MIEITKFKPSDRASAEVFNKRLEEIETYIKNVVEENKALKKQLDNKVDKVTVYSINQLSVQDLQNGGFEHNYETTTNKASEIGLGSGIWHIKYLKYVSAEGYGFQIALPVTGDVPKWRKAWGNEFKAWQNL